MTGAGADAYGTGTGAGRDTTTVVVVGGGIAGLSAAWAITSAAPGTNVVVLESDRRLGGKVQTGTIGGRVVELGPDAFLTRRPEAVALCRELGLGDDLVSPGSRTAYVWARGELRRLPGGLALGVPTRLGPLARSGILSPWGVGRVALDPLRWRRPRAGEARDRADRPVAAITRHDLGREVTERLVDPLIGGIHAGDTRLMSTAAVFPALLDAAARGGSLMRALREVSASAAASASASVTGPGSGPDGDPPVFNTVRGGLSRLVDRLAGALGARGVDVRLETGVDRLERAVSARGSSFPSHDPTRWALHTARGTVEADAVVIATPATTAAALLEPVDRVVAAMLGEITYADVTLVTLRIPADGVRHSLEGTGFLVPASTGLLVTACTWLTSKWPELQRPGDVLLRASTGRFGDDRPAHMSDDELVGRVLDELGPMLGLEARPTEVVVTRWREAFPQYAVGHLERVSAIEEASARLPGLALAGAAYRGVGIPACIASGRRAAEVVLDPTRRARQSTS
jgi:protoporphyrinogen/coproporphyrinogen III oxidase